MDEFSCLVCILTTDCWIFGGKIIGENCFMWFGSNPAIVISDHQMIKEILSKNYVFQKTSSPLDKLLTRGLATYEADKWAKHRRLLNPAFHLEKLKVFIRG